MFSTFARARPGLPTPPPCSSPWVIRRSRSRTTSRVCPVSWPRRGETNSRLLQSCNGMSRMCNHVPLRFGNSGDTFMQTFEFLRREPEIRDYKKGRTIFKQGDPGSDCMFGVVEGAIDIQVGTETVERVLPSAVFGEMALIDQRPRSATAVAD